MKTLIVILMLLAEPASAKYTGCTDWFGIGRVTQSLGNNTYMVHAFSQMYVFKTKKPFTRTGVIGRSLIVRDSAKKQISMPMADGFTKVLPYYEEEPGCK